MKNLLLLLTVFAAPASVLAEEYCVGIPYNGGMGGFAGRIGINVRCGNLGKEEYPFSQALCYFNVGNCKSKFLKNVEAKLAKSNIHFVTEVQIHEGALQVYKKGAVPAALPEKITAISRLALKNQLSGNVTENIDLYLKGSLVNYQGTTKGKGDYSNVERLMKEQECTFIARVQYVDRRTGRKDYILVTK